MSKKTDKLFRDKLGEMQSTPGVEAWQALEDHLMKKKRKALFWRIAAAACLLLLFSMGILFWNLPAKEENTPMISEEATEAPPSPEVIPEIVDEPEVLQAEVVEEMLETEAEQPEQEAEIYLAEQEVQLPEEPVDEAVSETEYQEVFEQLEMEPLLVEAESAEEAETKLPPITIEYKSGPRVAANEQPLDTGNNKGLIQKIAKVAKDVRGSDLGMASLREAKDDFLAFRKKEKSEVQNN